MIGAQYLLGMFAAIAVVASDMPRMLAIPFALLAIGYGCTQGRREARRQPRALVWPMHDGPVTLDGVALEHADLQWRGPLAFLRWRDHAGNRGYLDWWPDTLMTSSRRELRLAAGRTATAPRTASMAP